MLSRDSPVSEVLEAGSRLSTAQDIRFARPRPDASRLLSLDLIRGYCVMVLVAVHLNYVPSLLGWFDGRGVLWVSEAEGFFLISGIVVALIGRRNLEKGGVRLAVRRAWRRGAQLYVVACLLTLLYTAFGRYAVSQDWYGVKVGLDEQSSWLDVISNTLTLRYVYGWADFLTFYVPLFLLAPLVFLALKHRLDALVVVTSLAVFASLTWISYGPAEPFLQWQAPFVLGAVIGYRFRELTAFFTGCTRRTRTWLSVVAVTAALAVYAAGMVMLYRPDLHAGSDLYEVLLANNRLGLLRPLLVIVTFAGVFVLLEHFRKPIMATVGPHLELFGKNSLYVYVVGSFVVFTVPFVLQPQGFVANTALDVGVIIAIWFALRKQFLTKYVPR